MKSFVKKFKIQNKSIKITFNLYGFLYEYAKLFSIEFGFYGYEFLFTFSLLFFSISFSLKNITFRSEKERDISFIIYKKYFQINLYEDLDSFEKSTRRYSFYYIDYFFGELKKIDEKMLANYEFVTPTINGNVISNVDIKMILYKRKYWFIEKLYSHNILDSYYDNTYNLRCVTLKNKMTYEDLLTRCIKYHTLNVHINNNPNIIVIDGFTYRIRDVYNYKYDDDKKTKYLISVYDGRLQGSYKTIYKYIDKVEFDRMCKLEEMKKLI